MISRTDGRFVRGLRPEIDIFDTSARFAIHTLLDAVRMTNATGGASAHYGNEADIVGGHIYRMTVTLRGERVTVLVAAPS